MRKYRRFQPSLDLMPSRIAPSASVAGVLPQVVVAAATVSLPGMAQPADTDMPETGGSSIIVIGTSGSSGTQIC